MVHDILSFLSLFVFFFFFFTLSYLPLSLTSNIALVLWWTVAVWTEAVVRLMAESIKTQFGGGAKLNREVLQLGMSWFLWHLQILIE